MQLRRGSKLAGSILSAARGFSTTPSAERKVAVLGAAGKTFQSWHQVFGRSDGDSDGVQGLVGPTEHIISCAARP